MVAANSLIREGVYNRLREEILSCVLLPGAELRESALAGRFGVSTSPVRDALLRLEADGLVHVYPRKGYRVAPVDPADVEELLELRAVIGQAAVREAVQRASSAALAELDRFRHFPSEAPDPDFTVYNRDFHSAVLILGGNQRMLALGRELEEQFRRLLRISLVLPGPRGPRLVHEHGLIVDALQARDGALAARLVGMHALRAKPRVLEALARQPGTD